MVAVNDFESRRKKNQFRKRGKVDFQKRADRRLPQLKLKFGANDRLCVNCPIRTAKTTDINCTDFDSTCEQSTKKLNKEPQPSRTASLHDNTLLHRAAYAILSYDGKDDDDDLPLRVCPVFGLCAVNLKPSEKSFHRRHRHRHPPAAGRLEKVAKPELLKNFLNRGENNKLHTSHRSVPSRGSGVSACKKNPPGHGAVASVALLRRRRRLHREHEYVKTHSVAP